MKRRISYFANRKNPLTWISALLLTVSVVCRIAYFCQLKGAEAQTVWFELILPVASGLLFCLILLLDGQEHLYRTAIPAALLFGCIAVKIAVYFSLTIVSVLVAIAALVCLVIYNVTLCGKLRHTWLLALILLTLLGAEVWLYRAALGSPAEALTFTGALARVALIGGVLFLVLALQPHLDGLYHPTWGDRCDGRRVRSLSPITYVAPYIMPDRNGASNSIHMTAELTVIEQYIHRKRREGLTNFGITHVFMGVFVRTVAQFPALNRFLAGQRIYSRDEDIQFCMIIKKDMTVESPDTAIKLHLNPADDIYTIYEKFNKAVEEVKNTPLDSSFDQVAHLLTLLPGVLLKFALWLIKLLDYFGLIPKFLLEVSPFHGSVFFTSMGSLGIPPVVHHLYDLGNLPVFCAFGCKRRENVLTDDGKVVPRKYVDYTLNLDERTVDGFYYAAALKYFERLLRHPERLDTPPETVLHDVD